MKNIIKKICSLLALIMIILNSSVLTTLSMAIDEISTNATANVSNDKKEKVKIYTSYKRLTNRLPNELTITGILVPCEIPSVEYCVCFPSNDTFIT